jgi:hypothetical protein
VEKADILLQGAIDMHAHGYPQFTLNMPPRVNNLEWAEAAAEAGMAGFVIKSHIWPTAAEAYLINKAVPNVRAFGSITLNCTVGGINPFAVQVAAESGAKVVFMPTWCSKNDFQKGAHYIDRMRPFVTCIDEAVKNMQGLSVLNDDGELTEETLAVIKICKQYGLVLATGHISIEESLSLCKAAAAEGVKFVLTHPLNAPLIGATLEQMKQVADMGGFIEHVFIGCMPMHQRMDPRRLAEAMEAVGPRHCTMASDTIEAWNPKPPEVLRMFIASMLALGVGEDDIYQMTHTNPAYLMDMAPNRNNESEQITQ